MVLTTTSAIDGKVITEYKGIVGSQVVAGINVFKDIFAGMRNIVGGRSKQLQESMRKMRSQALLELKEEAFSLNANAVVGIRMDFDEYAEHMLMLTASGTAVKVQ
ncbi:MAG: YbjQ family protein [Planctomycetes bacterium]|nr:YbjQ family protein [Planctomycetota bacterium]